MNYENKLFDIEENKSENENRILPTDNFHFSTNKKSKNKIKCTLSNKIESKKSYKDFIKTKNNNNQNLFSNVILKELLAKNLINNELKPSIIQNNNYLENNNKIKQEKKNSQLNEIEICKECIKSKEHKGHEINELKNININKLKNNIKKYKNNFKKNIEKNK